MAGFVTELFRSAIDMVGEFGQVASVDPLTAVLLVVGAVLVLFPVAVMGFLSLGALADLVTRDSPGRAHPPRE